MFRLALLGCGAVNLALGVDEPPCSTTLRCRVLFLRVGLERVEAGTAGVALVTPGAGGMTYGALALDEAIGKEGVV